MPATTGTLVLMGSGETTPTMVTIHQKLFTATEEATGSSTVAAALLDTPYGFQANAGEISDKARHYFSHHVGREVGHLAAPEPAGADALTVEATLDAIRQQDWLFAGPGSPSYASRQWLSAAFPEAMTEVVSGGGTLVMASAAAVTAGSRTIPVYEVYKAGAPTHWLDGLGLMQSILGWDCVVIPHFDNAEGGTHDTRFCYLGLPRLELLEGELDEGEWVLGIDEHTAAIFDVAAKVMRVSGRGAVHVRRGGVAVARFDAGQEVAFSAVTGATEAVQPVAAESREAVADDGGPAETPFDEEVAALSTRFDRAIADLDAAAATAATLELEALIRAWAADTDVNQEQERATARLRGMITRLGTLAGEGMHDHTDLVRPHIETLLHVREDARANKAFEVADHIRVHLDDDGVRLKDTRDGTQWEWDEPELPSKR